VPNPDPALFIVSAILQRALCEPCIHIKTGVPRAMLSGYLVRIGEVMTVTATQATCDGCQEQAKVYRIA